ncbi:hypothetical protein HFO42_07555 [Rhizobium leguminosarum]|uniref:Uncharacterized protein n=1 Tax=Rhizobium leguminosarum TaxID=384 RepID=A0AAJ1ECX7_RHILE|nr:hypothetical protein [Rhizobium leguminosarum]MBY5532828.1 hypothetical protein [Rhizobium leguminosarum]MBY5594294.1 hypothetical protein [Rhizobium leguminosarum]MBY5627971.1 hypothetical protein [Rhizobium leguminosarum]
MPPLDVNDAKKRTKEALELYGIDTTNVDLSYITKELLEEYQGLHVIPHRADQADPTWNPDYYGNSPVFWGDFIEDGMDGVWRFHNGTKDLLHKPQHKCGESTVWEAILRHFRFSPCPNDKPKGGFEGRFL